MPPISKEEHENLMKIMRDQTDKEIMNRIACELLPSNSFIKDGKVYIRTGRFLGPSTAFSIPINVDWSKMRFEDDNKNG